jgi:hypothetical protein
MDADLVTNAATVLLNLEPMEREIETRRRPFIPGGRPAS